MSQSKTSFCKIVKEILKVMFMLCIQVAQFYIVVNWAILNNVIPQFFGMFGGFLIGKASFKEEFHVSTLTMCTIITCITFISTCKITPNLQTSIIMQSISGVFLALIFSIFEIIRKEHKWFEKVGKDG